VANFPISGRRPDKDFVLAHVRIKLAAARANCQPGWLSEEKRDAIAVACDKILAGEYSDEFVVDRFQAGAGTSHNMNSNEVIANLANVALGGERAYTPVNPNDDVNMGQSTNDTITAIRLAVLAKLPRLVAAVHAMAAEFSRLAEREKDTVKSGRPICRTRCRPRWAGIRRLRVDACPLRRQPGRRAPGAVRNRSGRLSCRNGPQHLARLPGARRRRTGHAHQ
jgi:aspartate ammonia-lyase